VARICHFAKTKKLKNPKQATWVMEIFENFPKRLSHFEEKKLRKSLDGFGQIFLASMYITSLLPVTNLGIH
jgi:hypothetical protein